MRALAWMAVGAVAIVLLPVLMFAGIGGGAPIEESGGSGDGSGALNSENVPEEYVPWVLAAGELCETIGPAVIAAQIEAESNWDPDAGSDAGAQGISQFMPGTWETWGEDANHNGVNSPYDPADAIMAQGRYDCSIAEQVVDYLESGQASGDPLDLTLAGYNAGPGAVQEYGGIPPYEETQTYVARIRSLIPKYEAIEGGGGEVPAGQTMAMPLAGDPPVTSPFGMRVHPITGEYKLHTGIDFGADEGTAVLAALDGTVSFAGWVDGYGNRVEISHTIDGQEVTTTYNHMSAINVSVGQNVGVGTSVGAVGSTGYSTAAHLHFEVEQNGEYVDPAPFLGL
jgi:murein DD-endopeptidase MepM/ murein hydrolase activator NlpD